MFSTFAVQRLSAGSIYKLFFIGLVTSLGTMALYSGYWPFSVSIRSAGMDNRCMGFRRFWLGFSSACFWRCFLASFWAALA